MSTDFARLRLKYHDDPVKMEEILQTECREKAASKLPELCSVQGFVFPSLGVTEMATSEALAHIHAGLVEEGDRILDMTAGLGVDAFAMARRGCHVTAIEIDPRTASALRKNVETLQLSRLITVIEDDSSVWLTNNSDLFDVIFIDPARRDAAGRHFSLSDCHPDVTKLMPLLLKRAKKVIVKASPMLNTDALQSFGAQAIAIGTATECKELLFTLPSDGDGRVRCITVGHGEYLSNNDSAIAYGTPKVGDTLLQPYPAVMKGGGNVAIEGVRKLNQFSHLYFSESAHPQFPGASYNIIDIIPFNKKGIREVRERYPEINVATRNFPLKAPELAARLKIKEGGRLMLFGTTGPDKDKILIICNKLKNDYDN